MAELNELLEEAAVRCGALSDELDDTVSGVRSVVERAGQLWETLSKGGEEARNRFKELLAQIDTAEQGLEQARADAAADLDSLGTKAEAVGQGVRDLLEKVNTGLQELQQHDSQLSQGIDNQVQAVGTDFNDLAGKIQEVQQGVDTQLQQAGQAITDLQTAVGEARNELNEKTNDWTATVDQLETGAQEAARTWTTAIQSLLSDQTTAMLEMANGMLTKHNETMEQLKTKFATEAALQFAAAIEPLRDRLENLVEQAGLRRDELSARSDEALQRVRAAVPVLEQLKTAFETSSRLG